MFEGIAFLQKLVNRSYVHKINGTLKMKELSTVYSNNFPKFCHKIQMQSAWVGLEPTNFAFLEQNPSIICTSSRYMRLQTHCEEQMGGGTANTT